MSWPTSAFAFLAAVLVILCGIALGRWLRLKRGVDLTGISRLLLTITQGLILLAILGGLDQRPLSRALAFAGPMSFAWGVLAALTPSGTPIGRWWQLWRWDLTPPPKH